MVLDEAHAVKNRSAARTTRLNRQAIHLSQIELYEMGVDQGVLRLVDDDTTMYLVSY